MIAALEFLLGFVLWAAVLWDGFATVVLPLTVRPSHRLSGYFYRLSWRLWSSVARGIGQNDLRLGFLAIYGPISVVLLLLLWATSIIGAFALIYHGLGPRLRGTPGAEDFLSLLYMSGSTFLTLGIGDVTAASPLGRFFVINEAASGMIFLGLVITYMPLLHQAYAAREVYNMLLHSRLGSSPVAIELLHRYAGPDRAEILRAHLHDAERWMAETLQSHLSHPVLAFYRAQHWGQSWLVSVAAIMDTCTLAIAAGEGIMAAQARLTYQMGIRLVADLCHALAVPVGPRSRGRLTEEEVPKVAAALKAAGLCPRFDHVGTADILRLAHEYETYLVALSDWLIIPMSDWLPPQAEERAQ